MTYADFDRKYLICPEETLAVHVILTSSDGLNNSISE
jgi:hypothetical protein